MAKEFHFYTKKNPKQARWAYLAHSGNHLEHRIHFILPAHQAYHIITTMYTFSLAISYAVTCIQNLPLLFTDYIRITVTCSQVKNY